MEYVNKFMLGRIKEASGTAARPQSTDNRSICVLNGIDGNFEINKNAEVSKIYPKAKEEYRHWWRAQQGFKLGEFKTAQLQSDTEVANLLIFNDKNELNIEATKKAFNLYGKHCTENKLNVHINKLTDEEQWKVISGCLEEFLAKRGSNVTVYV